MVKSRENRAFNGMYIIGHLRGDPFFMGMALGYILTTYKPSNYRKVISKVTGKNESELK